VEGPVDDRSHRRRRASVYAMVLSGFPVFFLALSYGVRLLEGREKETIPPTISFGHANVQFVYDAWNRLKGGLRLL
jgi:hypothetical protein